jgi:predicted LPLAT superfamily acyltransferase
LSPASRWSELREVGFLSGIRFLFWVYRKGGMLVFKIALQPVLLYYFLSNRTARSASLDYLRRIKRYFPECDLPKPGLLLAYRHFNAFATSSLDRLAVWADTNMLDQIQFPNRPLLMQQLSTGRGAVLLGAHLGNMEICRGLSTRNPDLKLNILVHTPNAQKFNNLLTEVVKDSSINLIEVSELSPATAILLQKRIEEGEFIAILADRIPVSDSRRCTRVPFLGQSAPFPNGPFILAALLKCPVYTLFCARAGKLYDISCDEFAQEVRLPRNDRERALADYIQRYARALENRLRDYPLQWFNFYPFWDQD